MTTKILIADDHEILLDSLSMLFDSIEGVEVVATAHNGFEALEKLEKYEIDLLVCDLHMPFMDGIVTTTKVKDKHPHTKVLMLSMAEDAYNIRRAMLAGVSGYLSKKVKKKELETALKNIAEGRNYFGENILKELINHTDESEDLKAITTPLSVREIEVMKLITKELSNQAIANALFISINTVESHRKTIYKKIGVNNTAGIIKFALKNGFY
jgi:DNA-binding NarL/FixJ family response regulator